MTPRIVLSGLLALGLGLACDSKVVSFHATTASIDTIELARGYDAGRGVGVGTTFTPGDTSLHAIVAVSAVPPDTGITGSWIAVEAAGVKDQLIDRSVLRAAAGTTSVHFTLSNDKPWPSGRYRFDVQIDGESLHSREFAIAEPAGAAATVALAAAPAGVAPAGVAPAAGIAPAPESAPAPVAPRAAAHASVAAPPSEPEPDDDAPTPADAATPAAAAPTPTPTPKPSAKSYAASVAGICDKMVDCGCEASASACGQTLANLNHLPRAVKSCVLRYDCAGLCGTGAQKCITDHYAAEAEVTRQIGEMSRKQREYWPTGGPSCRAGYHLVGGTCYAD